MPKKRKSLGLSFSDEVVKITAKTGHFTKSRESDWTDVLLPNYQADKTQPIQKSPWRIMALFALCIILFFIIFLRLFHLQIAEGKINRELADGNRIQVKVIHAPRGVIFDRNGKILAANAPAFRFFDKDTKKSRLVTREEAFQKEAKNDPEAQNLEIDNVRIYPFEEEFAHTLGYVGQISESELKEDRYKDYSPGDAIGQMGLEAQYENLLRGKDGGEIIEVDSKGEKLRTLRRELPISGQNIYLSVDADLQGVLFQEMKKALTASNSCCGAAVAMEPFTGKILALVSFPSFDSNLFTQGENDSVISEILSDSAAPILNRVIAGTYPPGSTYKIISSLAALSSGKITADTAFQDNGVMYLGIYKFTNWYFNQYGKTEGSVNLQKALQRSNDIYFYQVGQIIGENALAQWSRKLYLGASLGIDLPGEESGIVPDNAWKQKTLNTVWYPGDTLHMAIGQGFVLTTPLQILGITSYIAADGTLYKPEFLLSASPRVLVSNLLSKEKIKFIKEGLELVPKEGGTAWPFFAFPIPTAGKTGTAEYGDSKDRSHAWYTSYAPVDDPKIALTVLIEGGGEGSSVAAPIAKEVYRWYFSPDKNKLIQDLYSNAIDSGRTLGE